jgi:hypothetical protein
MRQLKRLANYKIVKPFTRLAFMEWVVLGRQRFARHCAMNCLASMREGHAMLN